MRKYLKVLNIGIQTNLIYRYNFFILAVAQFCPLISTLILWNAIFQSSGQSHILGYSHAKIVTYYVLSMVIQQIIGLWFLDYEITSDIRNGQINRFLLRPIDYLWYQWTTILSRKLILAISNTLPVIAGFYILRDQIVPPFGVVLLLMALGMSILGLYINFLITCCAGLIGFWLLEVSSLFFIYYILNFFLSGGMFPLDMLPKPFFAIVRWLPFQYMGYYQIKLYMGDYTVSQGWQGLLAAIAWIIALSGLSKYLWQRGTRRYSAFGG
jgi:ABC-2 type transport system permease protein